MRGPIRNDDCLPHFNRQPQPQPEQGLLPVLFLTAPFTGLGGNLCRPMLENDRRLDFVPVLASRPRAARTANVAVSQEPLDR